MIISLLGYMGSGKSHISKIISQKINFRLFDLDEAISEAEKLPVPEIFRTKGEIYFRKREKEILEKILKEEDSVVLSLGGGTPVYYDNMALVNAHSKSIFLRTGVMTLAERLQKEKMHRPLIAHLEDQDVPEFIAKHLFERNAFYNQAHHTVDTDGKTPEKIAEEIMAVMR